MGRLKQLVASLIALSGIMGCTPHSNYSEAPGRTGQAGSRGTVSAPPAALPSGAMSSPAPRPSPSALPSPAPSASPSPKTEPSATPSTAVRSSDANPGGNEPNAPIMAQAPAPVVPDLVVRVSTIKGQHRFDTPRVDVYAGQTVEIIFRNNAIPGSGTYHNWVLIKPGTEKAVAAVGKDAGVDPAAVTYSPSILASTRIAGPGKETVVDFAAPEQPGEYPFISLVGDQWKVMRGVMVVHPLRGAVG